VLISNGDEVITDYPYQQDVFYNAEPVYETFEGWSEDITSVKSFDALPENAKKYINAIEKFIEVPITFISVGPERNQNIVINND
jgi:Adenylosuccinate synthase